MARVLLAVPPLPLPLGAPYLGQQYLAASLLAAGHDVFVADAGVAGAPDAGEEVVATAARLRPDLVGLTLFTHNAATGYELARRLRPYAPLLVAGGPHATACPEEALAHGFDVVVRGEGETLLPRLAAARSGTIAPCPGLRRAGAHDDPPGEGRHADLDALPSPRHALPLYGPAAATAGGLVTSRGCPARCTFCANYVTGRAPRWHSAAYVVAELVALRETQGLRHFAFWDDAFTARPARVRALLTAMAATPALAGATWSCITPAALAPPRLLAEMRDAGCIAVNFGLESGDPRILREVGRDPRPERVVAAVTTAHDLGMQTVVNFMFGFPGEGLRELDATRALMERLAPVTTVFNPHGVLVPMPGTAIYERWHTAYGFTDWWLDPARLPSRPLPATADPDALHEWLATDAALDLDFFRYPPDVRACIAEAVRFKAEHNRRAYRPP